MIEELLHEIINSVIVEGDCYFKWTELLQPK